MKLDKKEVYNSSYKGVSFEIVCRKEVELGAYEELREKERFTYYLYLQLGKIPEKNNPESFWLVGNRIKLTDSDKVGILSYKEYDHAVIGSIEFHGGITYYSKESSEDQLPEERVIKIGCDYAHYADEGRIYNLDYILHDVKNSIDSFKAIVPDYKWFCHTVDGLWDASEGIVSKNGDSFISNKGIEWRKKQGYDIPDCYKIESV